MVQSHWHCGTLHCSCKAAVQCQSRLDIYGFIEKGCKCKSHAQGRIPCPDATDGLAVYHIKKRVCWQAKSLIVYQRFNSLSQVIVSEGDVSH